MARNLQIPFACGTLFTLLGSHALADEAVVLDPAPKQAAVAAVALFAKPRVGLRVGVGQWKSTTLNGGFDVTFKVPVLPIPALRFDAEVWGKMNDLGGKRGNAISLLAVQPMTLAYVGIGPAYYFTSDDGDHRSGFGAKLLVGANLVKSFYVEGSTILGPSPAPVTVWLGMRF